MTGSPIIGIVAEGPTDQVVLQSILTGYFNDPDLVCNQLEPEWSSAGTPELGGWTQVIAYCGSDRLRSDIQTNDYIIIQIDTDVSQEPGYNVQHKQGGKDLTVEQLVMAVRQRLMELIGQKTFEQVSNRVFFAICVHDLECWLIPLFPNISNPNKKITGCLKAINSELNRTDEGYYIDPARKDHRYYEKLSRPYQKRKELSKAYSKNTSFELFIQALDATFGQLNKD